MDIIKKTISFLQNKSFSFIILLDKAPFTPNGDATAFVQRSKTMSARCGVAAKYTPINIESVSYSVYTTSSQRPYSVYITFPQRLYSVHDVFTARKLLLQRVDSAQTARSRRTHSVLTARAHSVLTAIIAFKVVFLLFYFYFE